MLVNCVNCDKEIGLDVDNHVVGESIEEYWCQDCTHTGSDER